MSTPDTYRQAVQYTLNTRWAGQKDSQKSARRALQAAGWALETDPHWSPFLEPHSAYALRDALEGRGLAPSTVNRFLAAYLAVWGSWYQARGTPEPPPTGLYRREPGGRTRTLSEREVDTVVARLGWPYGNVVRVLAETGCRVSEALRLKPGDVDLLRSSVTFRGTKNGDDREVPLSAAALVAAQGVGWSTWAGLSQSALNHEWSTVRASLGLEGDPQFVPHALRHTAVTRWVAAGVPLAVVAKLAGHRSIKTTMRYTHVSTKDCLTALERAGIL